MKNAYFIADNIISSLGFNTAENIAAIEKQISGITLIYNVQLSAQSFYGSQVNSERLKNEFQKHADPNEFTRFEQFCIISISDALKNSKIDITNRNTLLILSTTKGNIELLNENRLPEISRERVFLWKTAEEIQNYFKLKNTPLVLSNACISGVVAIITAARLIEREKYKNVIVCGADILTKFVISGFQSFLALSSLPCKPFDKNRNGLNLGEGCGTVILSSEPNQCPVNNIVYCGGSISNDASHISGPSRTGEGLYLAMKKTAEQSRKKLKDEIGFISVHGTATPFNDEMEAIAFKKMGYSQIPLVGLKGYFGHTLGAAGVIETIAAMHSLKRGILHATVGFENSGVSVPINVISKTTEKEINSCLKVASGFGGCNAAAIFAKI
ncbi:MAG: beta-ketoacyl synthase [Bacteroidetes bacterium CG23_combo_of_CG06-09_8_20_14_all_32_9]|nr:MAG: beta-ketoacyl synthase [Bacteroidetes bacterium CG23_combo_of_CG06-09_8_20_14_all_32_9]